MTTKQTQSDIPARAKVSGTVPNELLKEYTADLGEQKRKERDGALGDLDYHDSLRPTLVNQVDSAFAPVWVFRTMNPKAEHFRYGYDLSRYLREAKAGADSQRSTGAISIELFLPPEKTNALHTLNVPRSRHGLLDVLPSDETKRLAEDIFSEADLRPSPELNKAKKQVQDWVNFGR